MTLHDDEIPMTADVLELRTRILRERARRTAARATSSVQREVRAHAVIVSIGGELFGIPAESVRELRPIPTITRLPGTPSFIRGIAYCRGELVSVVDLGRWFGASDVREPAYMALLRGRPGHLGIGVDEVVGFRAIHADELTELDEGSSRPVVGVTADLVALLDVERLLGSKDVVMR